MNEWISLAHAAMQQVSKVTMYCVKGMNRSTKITFNIQKEHIPVI